MKKYDPTKNILDVQTYSLIFPQIDVEINGFDSVGSAAAAFQRPDGEEVKIPPGSQLRDDVTGKLFIFDGKEDWVAEDGESLAILAC